jgi:ubiquinone/menaquinone biosynthesis C-methylase UbiE
MSSVTGDPERLSDLANQMAWFYGEVEGRALYQDMLAEQEESAFPESSVRHLLPKHVCDLKPANVLEIGCGDGRVFRQLRSYGFTGAYTGIEVADYIIEQNSRRHPDVTWMCANAYDIPSQDCTFEACFSLYVLEHLVYPERALREMIRVLVPGGRLLLVFPDFVESNLLSSQMLGFSPTGTALSKLRAGKVLDALISLYDSRVRLPNALKNAAAKYGPFPVNIQPVCLSYPSLMSPDVDAVYIASKREVQRWAETNGHKIEYPYGTEGELADQAFLVITKK